MKLTVKNIVPNPEGRLIAVSDIHGYGRYLEGLLEKISFSRKDTLVVVGDVIEKGPESLKTVRLLQNLQKEGYDVHTSMGNVDYGRIRHLMDDASGAGGRFLDATRWIAKVWKKGLFLDMLEELGIDLEDYIRKEAEKARGAEEAQAPENAEKESGAEGARGAEDAREAEAEAADRIRIQLRERFREEIDFLWNQPTILTAGNFIFVHAGIPTEDLAALQEMDLDPTACLKTDAFLTQEHSFQKYVVVGHWPVCLYRTREVNVNPIYDAEKHVIAIDGGCALKVGAQLNALILPGNALSMEGAAFEAYDDYPVFRAPRAQAGREADVFLQYTDAEVEVLGIPKKGPGDMAHLRHKSSGREFLAPASFLYHRDGRTYCEDYSDAELEVAEGEELSLILETSAGRIVKKKGVIGWYEKDHFHGPQRMRQDHIDPGHEGSGDHLPQDAVHQQF